MTVPNQPPVHHDHLPYPAPPYTVEEMNLIHSLGRHNGGAAVNALRARDQQVFHITTPAPPAQVIHVNGGGVYEESIDVLVAFVIFVVATLISWAIFDGNHYSVLNALRWGLVTGFIFGVAYLAISQGIRRVLR